jgi:hypothetical protein
VAGEVLPSRARVAGWRDPNLAEAVEAVPEAGLLPREGGDTLRSAPVEVWQAGDRVPAEDVEELPDLGSAFNDLSVWRYHVAKARFRGM